MRVVSKDAKYKAAMEQMRKRYESRIDDLRTNGLGAVKEVNQKRTIEAEEVDFIHRGQVNNNKRNFISKLNLVQSEDKRSKNEIMQAHKHSDTQKRIKAYQRIKEVEKQAKTALKTLTRKFNIERGLFADKLNLEYNQKMLDLKNTIKEKDNQIEDLKAQLALNKKLAEEHFDDEREKLIIMQKNRMDKAYLAHQKKVNYLMEQIRESSKKG